jgi:hypothetical protein
MKSCQLLLSCVIVTLFFTCATSAQQAASGSTAIVPRLVNFSGHAADAQGKPVTGIAGLTFAIYKDQYAGSPLWSETQNVQADSKGNYTVQLGASSSQGLPMELFALGEARWLGVRVNGGDEQPRVLLLSVPYALKAADAQTLGGLPASAFVLAAPLTSPNGNSTGEATATGAGMSPSVGGTGTQDFIPLWTDNNGTLGNSAMFQLGTGPSAKIGINLKNPLFTLDINGQELVRGLLELATTNFANKNQGFNSNPFNFESSAFNSNTGKYTLNHFQWQAEPVGNNTASPGATLNLLYGQEPGSPAETGLKLSSTGIFTFASGQTFPGAGTVTSVALSAPTSDFKVSGSPITKSGTLALSWTVAPTSANTANAIVKRDSTGSFNAGQIAGVTSNTTPAVLGSNLNNDDSFAPGVEGNSPEGIGVYGISDGNIGVDGNGAFVGVNGATVDGYGVMGTSGTFLGVYGNSVSAQGIIGESGSNTGFGFGPDGVDGISHFGGGSGIGAFNDTSGDGIYAFSSTGFAGFFLGDVDVDGNLSKAGGSFKIDHPLDPANKYLYHSFVESPDMKNIYDGNATTDGHGDAVITLPDWFEALNRDFRYQLTVIGQFAQAIVAKEIENNQFNIKTDKPNVKVSWQVTGIRQDAWANAHRIPLEQAKAQDERGLYLHPELFGAAPEKAIGAKHYPYVQKLLKKQAVKAATPEVKAAE